ncbi:MAG: orotidine-5'-phosphate decarboxylase [Candidatus Kerfeldbacteria bacterium]
MPDQTSSLIVALDVPTIDKAVAIVTELSPFVSTFKVGLELTSAEGLPRVVWAIQNAGGKVIVDLKLHDIPNTVARASRAIAALQPKAFTVHTSGGPDMIRAAVDNRGDAMVLGITVLTSFGNKLSGAVYGRSAWSKVLQFARMLLDNGAHGIVCSPREVQLLRSDSEFDGLTIVTPGVRPEWASVGDQVRTATPYEAMRNGASAVVIGRPITNPPEGMSRLDAAQRILAEITEGQLAAPRTRL